MRSPVRRAASIIAIGSLAASGSAAVVHFTQNDLAREGSFGVSFAGTSEWSFDGGNSGLLEITITNTTAPSIGGALTGFAFNIGGHSASIELLSSTVDAFVGMTGVSAPPFGHAYAAGAAIGANWTGGGRPHGGLAPGQTGVFVFELAGQSLGMLGSGSVLDGPYEHDFVVRFRGLADGGSAKTAAVAAPEIPAPGGAALMAVALAVGAGRRRSTKS